MARNDQHYTMYQGEVTPFTVPVVNSAGAPVTLTGAAITWTLRERADSAALVTKSTGAGSLTLTTTAATDDTLSWTLAGADTASLAPGSYYHEAAITGSQAAVLLTGVLTIRPSAVL